jgi:uncharacterized protein YdhG (YjbR/CyaY superfamily)
MNEYIHSFPGDIQTILEDIRETIQKAAPESVEAISYGIPTFKLDGKNMVHFAGWKTHIGFYPTPSALKAFAKELSRYKGAKGSVQFPLDEPMPLDLVRRIVAYRVRDIRIHEKPVRKTKK